MRLSIAMIVKNEEKYLEKCLLSTERLKNKIDYEIIIIDTGSTDNTMSIARQFTDKVYESKWNNDFSYMRNLSISYCKGDWVLILDADEVIENPDKLVSILSESDIDEFNSIGIYQKNFLNGMDEDNYSIISVFRLLKRNNKFKFEGTIHEQPNIIYPRKESDITLLHYGYNNGSFEKLEYRNERNKKLLLKELEFGNMDKRYVLFQLARTFINEHDNSRAFRCINRAYNMDKDVDGILLAVYKQFASQLFNEGEYERCTQVLDEVKEYLKENLDYYYYNAMSYLKTKDYYKSEKFFNGYFNLYEKKKQGKLFMSQIGEDSLKCVDGVRINFAICLFKQKKYTQVVKIYNSFDNCFGAEKLSREYIYSAIVLDNYKLLNIYLKDCYNDNKMNIVSSVLDDLYSQDFDVKKLIGVNENLDKYISLVYLNKNKYDLNKFDFSGYYLWKARILKQLVLIDKSNLKYLEGLNLDDVYKYINYLNFNYNLVGILLDYSKCNFLSLNRLKQNVVYAIQKVLLCNKLVVEDKFYNLLNQAFVSNCILLGVFLNPDKLNNMQSVFFNQILDKYSVLWIDFYRILKNIDILQSISEIKKILKCNKKYIRIIEYFINDNILKSNNLLHTNEKVKEEKNNILKLIEDMITNGEVHKALEIINELSSIYKYDGNILLNKGVILYLSGKLEEAIMNLSLSYILLEEKFEPLYNIAIVLEEANQPELSIQYYKKCYEVCKDEEIKKGIMEKIKDIRVEQDNFLTDIEKKN